MSKFIIFDTETTGLKVEVNQIAQLSYMIIDKELNILKSKNFYFKVKKVENKASEINGLTVEKLEKLSGGKSFKDFSEEIFKDFNNSKIICHNVKFDLEYLTEEFKRINMDLNVKGSFCTMLNYKDKLKIKHEKFGYKFPKLEEVIKFLDVKEDIIKNVLSVITDDKNVGYHDARYDIACTYMVFKYLEYIYPRTDFEKFLEIEKPKKQPVSLEKEKIMENATEKKKTSFKIFTNLVEKLNLENRLKVLKEKYDLLTKKKI